MFQVWSNGTLSIVVDPSHTDALAFDFLHEVGHYFDWAILSPTGSMSTELLPAELRDWANAVGGSQAHRELLRIVNDPQTIHHTLDDGTSVELVEDVQYALYLLQVEELFARSFCQFVAEVSQDPILLGELDRARANHYPEHWQAGDFQPIRDAIEELLGTP